MNHLDQAVAVARRNLAGEGAQFALIGGFAVSARAEARFTRDVDIAVAVADDSGAEQVVRSLLADGHELKSVLEQEASARLATARFRLVGGADLDLLFASSGIEPEVVAGAEQLPVATGVVVPVATVGHLIALKLLSRAPHRPLDEADLLGLRDVATPADLEQAAAAVRLIEERGYARGRDLVGALRDLVG